MDTVVIEIFPKELVLILKNMKAKQFFQYRS